MKILICHSFLQLFKFISPNEICSFFLAQKHMISVLIVLSAPRALRVCLVLYFTSILPAPQKPILNLHNHCWCCFVIFFMLVVLKSQSTFECVPSKSFLCIQYYLDVSRIISYLKEYINFVQIFTVCSISVWLRMSQELNGKHVMCSVFQLAMIYWTVCLARSLAWILSLASLER